jgi:hypothetical protein
VVVVVVLVVVVVDVLVDVVEVVVFCSTVVVGGIVEVEVKGRDSNFGVVFVITLFGKVTMISIMRSVKAGWVVFVLVGYVLIKPLFLGDGGFGGGLAWFNFPVSTF